MPCLHSCGRHGMRRLAWSPCTCAAWSQTIPLGTLRNNDQPLSNAGNRCAHSRLSLQHTQSAGNNIHRHTCCALRHTRQQLHTPGRGLGALSTLLQLHDSNTKPHLVCTVQPSPVPTSLGRIQSWCVLETGYTTIRLPLQLTCTHAACNSSGADCCVQHRPHVSLSSCWGVPACHGLANKALLAPPSRRSRRPSPLLST